MSADLTVDNLCAAIRFFFNQIIEHPELPVDREKGLVLFGTPGDDTMRMLMEACGGTIKITVKEMPVAMQETFSADIADGQGAVVWEPSKEPETAHFVDCVVDECPYGHHLLDLLFCANIKVIDCKCKCKGCTTRRKIAIKSMETVQG